MAHQTQHVNRRGRSAQEGRRCLTWAGEKRLQRLLSISWLGQGGGPWLYKHVSSNRFLGLCLDMRIGINWMSCVLYFSAILPLHLIFFCGDSSQKRERKMLTKKVSELNKVFKAEQVLRFVSGSLYYTLLLQGKVPMRPQVAMHLPEYLLLFWSVHLFLLVILLSLSAVAPLSSPPRSVEV